MQRQHTRFSDLALHTRKLDFVVMRLLVHDTRNVLCTGSLIFLCDRKQSLYSYEKCYSA